MAVDSRLGLAQTRPRNKKKRKVVDEAFPTPPVNRATESFNSALDSHSETSSPYSTLSDELLLIAEKYQEVINDQDRSQLTSSLWRGATNFLVKFKVNDQVDLNQEILYEGSTLTIMDLCILLNALRSRYNYFLLMNISLFSLIGLIHQ
jgi:hypothetical protein